MFRKKFVKLKYILPSLLTTFSQYYIFYIISQCIWDGNFLTPWHQYWHWPQKFHTCRALIRSTASQTHLLQIMTSFTHLHSWAPCRQVLWCNHNKLFASLAVNLNIEVFCSLWLENRKQPNHSLHTRHVQHKPTVCVLVFISDCLKPGTWYFPPL